MKIYYKIAGAHVHCRVFLPGALCGELTFRETEWNSGVKGDLERISVVTSECDLVEQDLTVSPRKRFDPVAQWSARPGPNG